MHVMHVTCCGGRFSSVISGEAYEAKISSAKIEYYASHGTWVHLLSHYADEVSEQVEESPAEAALRIEASVYVH